MSLRCKRASLPHMVERKKSTKEVSKKSLPARRSPKKARAAKSGAARTLYTSISTKTARPVRLVRIFKLEYREGSIIELRAFFSGIWDVERLSLLYGNASWLKSFRAGLQEIGFSPDVTREIDYSEMGMQGIDYVSLDAPDEIVKEWPRVRRVLYAREREFARRLARS